MAAFDRGSGGGMGEEIDLNDILQQMFGAGGPGRPGGPVVGRQKGRDEEKVYEVTLEELYKGKTAKFASTKNTICSHCNGTGGKEKAKPKQCAVCQGQGSTTRLRSIGPRLVTQETVSCNSCKGSGTVYKDKDRCKKCKGDRVVEEKKPLEIYIPRGSKNGDRIVLEGEADQVPGQQPGDIIFTLKEVEHEIFTRAGADLQATLDITLGEALCGFSRVVLTHLDGRGIQITQPQGRILRPSQVVKVPGEGMPLKKSDMRGDLYLVVNVEFPDDSWARDRATLEQVQKLLPRSDRAISADVVDEVEFDVNGDLEDFGAGSGDPRSGSGWVDEDTDDDDDGRPQCAPQ